VSSQRPGEGQSSLLGCLLRLAAESAGAGHLGTTPELLRLSQARGHLCAGQVFVHERHVGTSVQVSGLVHRDQLLSLSSVRSERPGKSQAGLLGELLGTAAGADRVSQLVTATGLLGVTEASAHVSASQVVVMDVHVSGSFDVVVERGVVVVRDAAEGD
jgi:hypothetical protein